MNQFQFIKCTFSANLRAILSTATAKLYLSPPELCKSFWQDLPKRASIFTQIHIVKFKTMLTTLRADIFAEQIFTILAINRENKLCETYKMLHKLENMLFKI